VQNSAEWYRSVPLPDGVTHLFEPHIRPFYRCNIWHVRGRDRSFLFDSGLGAVSLVGHFPWLKDAIAIASHTHFDHVGNHHEFAERACHVLEAHILAAPTPANNLSTRFAKLDMFDCLPPDGFDETGYRVRAAPATRLLQAGDIVDLGDRHFEVLHVPGHSPGSIALWEPPSGILLAGDAVYDGELVDDAYHSNPEDYVDTMGRLRELPVRVVHAGHYPSFGRARYRELIDDYVTGRRQPGCPRESPSRVR
jgi:glyoxylase-like metal-dependent hydrolase (beta-lactamase superfamily II)